jgi:SAM dependent carboxyl methyltransferase
VGTALETLRGRHPDRPLQAIHNDLPSSDFSELFKTASGPDGYLRLGGAVYALAAAGSFFQQVVPSGSVDLGMCSNAAHWLREQPTPAINDGMYFCEAEGRERAAIAGQATADWLAFLEARAAELRPEGRLLVQGIGSSEDGERVSASRLLRVMWRAAADLAEEGLLDRGVLGGYVFPVYCRTAAEAAAPLGDGPLGDRLELVDQRLDEVSNPYWEEYERSGDAEAYARTYTEFVRAFAESTMLAGLFEPGATGVEPAELCDRYFERLEELNAADPESGRYEAWILRLVFRAR